MNQLEQIVARATRAERSRDEASQTIIRCKTSGIDPQNHRARYARDAGALSAYIDAAALARPLQEAVNNLRCDIWGCFQLEAAQRDRADAAEKASNPEQALRHLERAEAYGIAARILHRTLEHSGLC